MPKFMVRLGVDVPVKDRVALQGMNEVLNGLRPFAVELELATDMKYVELRVDQAILGLDYNVEALVVELKVEENDTTRRSARTLRDRLTTRISDLLAWHRVPLSVVPDFQVVLIVGGHETGVVKDRRWSFVEPHTWMDPYLREFDPDPEN